MTTRKIICIFDTAIDRVLAETPNPTTQEIPLVIYSRTRDMADITPCLIPNEAPTVFEIQPLSRAQVNGPMAHCSTDQERAVAAFTWGLVAIENALDANGQLVSQWRPTGVQGDKTYCTTSDLEFISPAEVQEIGTVIYQLSFLPLKMCRKLRPPSTSLDLLARMAP